jgi:hypothetical protein
MVDRQHLAFAYLRDRARRAHAEGDGTLVNSLCPLALSQAGELAQKHQLQLTLSDLKWAIIMPLFWLIDDFMLRAVDEALKLPFSPSPQHDALFKVLQAYYFLVREPMANIDEQIRTLTEMSFETLGEGNQCEDFVLLTHSIELVWYRDPNEGRWQKLADDWIGRAPLWCKEVIQKLRLRLSLQTRLTVPNAQFPRVNVEEALRLPEELRLAELWIYAVNCEWKGVDEAIKRISAGTSPRSHTARLLFDYHHSNRWDGDRGEPQQVGLTRRRLFTASAPLLNFNDIRESRLAEKLGRLFRYDQAGHAHIRFDVFQLAMLCELSALRLWDRAAWEEATTMQSEALLEAAKWEGTHQPGLVAHGILLAARSTSYEPQDKDALFRMALSRLELADGDILPRLVDGLLAIYPRQYYRVYEVLVDLADLIPAKQWAAVTEWGLKFCKAMADKHTAGSTAYPFVYLTEIVRYAEPESAIWTSLHPELLKMANSPLNWFSEGGRLIDAWLDNAPIDSAKALGLAMLAVPTTDHNYRRWRFNLLCGAERTRPELKGTFTSELRKLATSPLEIISLSDADAALRTQAKNSLKQAIDSAVKQATPAPGTKTLTSGSTLPVPDFESIEWNEDDLPVLKQLIGAVDDPAVLTGHLPPLLSGIQIMVRTGPKVFAEQVFPRFQEWIEHPPLGRGMDWPVNPFSVVQISDASLSQIPEMLGWIGFQLLFKLSDPVAPVLAKWIQNSVLNPEPNAIPIMIYVGIPAAIHLPPASRIDLLSACQGLFGHLLLRHRAEPEHGWTLAKALRYWGMLMRKKDHPLVKWDSEAAQASLDLLVPKLSLALVEASKSTNPDVRAAVATVLRNLEEWMALPAALAQIVEKLATDNRARVRHQARPRPQAAL